MATTKGFIQDWLGNKILPITRGELVLDKDGIIALNSEYFLAGADDKGLPGLVTAAERAMLSGGAGGNGIKDIYDKLGFINNGLKFNNSVLNFYSAANAATPINISSVPANGVTIGVTGNDVSFSLTALTTAETSASGILKSITVDKFGRVTAVSGSALTNAEIPAELTGKTLTNATLSNCVTSDKEIGTDEKSIANKAYVDAKFDAVSLIATGALKFSGPLSDADTATSALTNKNSWNNYYKVTKEFTLNTSDLYDTTGITGTTLTVKVGDTIIVYPISATAAKLVYVPSGDDITTITVKEDGSATDAVHEAFGPVTLKFASIFNVTGSGKTATISFPQVTTSQSGYLSNTDYAKFANYENTLKVTYAGDLAENTPGRYKIGTLTVGSGTYDLYGRNSESALVLNNGTANEYNPILKFTETGVAAVEITFKGLNGIKTKKNGSNVEIYAANEVIDQDVPQPHQPRKVKYLTITNGYQFGVQIGAADDNGNVSQDGLVDFSQFNALVNKVSLAASYETITYSLNGAANENEYRYGNTKLKAAINVTI